MTTPSDKPREVMMPVPQSDALTMTHIEALRAVGGQVSMLNTTVAGMAADVKSTREEVIKLVAQDLKTMIVANRTEALALIKDVDEKTDGHGRAISRLQGIILPVGVLATAILTYLAQWLANVTHHP